MSETKPKLSTRIADWFEDHPVQAFFAIVGVLIVGVTITATILMGIPTCTTFSDGATLCSRYITPTHREIWWE